MLSIKLLVLALLLTLVFAAPTPRLAVPTTITRLTTQQQASFLLSTYTSVISASTIDVDPEASNPLNVTSWSVGDTAQRCIEVTDMKNKLSKAFQTIARNLDGDKRKARSYLRSVYGMSKPITIEGTFARCLSNANYEEITDILVSFAAKSAIVGPATIAAASPVRAVELTTTERVIATPTRSPTPAPTKVPTPTPTPVPYCSCPYWHTVCCTAYCTPGVSNPQQVYLDCCFQDQYPAILADWDYIAPAATASTPEEYTLRYCMLSSI